MKEKFKKIINNLNRSSVFKFSILTFVFLSAFLFIAKLANKPLVFPMRVEDAISAKKLNSLLDTKDFVFINVHTPYEGEIQMTDLFVEHDSIKANERLLPKDKTAKIILYCKSGKMSAEALNTLKSMGYMNVSHLSGGMNEWQKNGYKTQDLSLLPDEVLPAEGFELPIYWEDYAKRLVDVGVIDYEEFSKLIDLTDEEKDIFSGKENMSVTINNQNSRFAVNVLWALGLAQRSIVYEEGPMGREYKNERGNFASTGGWNLAKGDAINYLGKHELIPLTQEQQKRVGEIAKNIYRPCCGNNTWFPDCNHGMAALAAIELMVSKDFSDEEIYDNVLKLNTFWFPDNYLTVATLFGRQGISWDEVNSKEVLGSEYSSANGAIGVSEKVGPLPYDLKNVGGSCGA